uniref:Uncharacterized protein n=1 Tax=Candidatus Desulfatibia profunda TaxID=2841695 RepID=A0A8J6NJW9_9BACT|nr:hypothetical protein [Candidatus Desulfatibia profunda]
MQENVKEELDTIKEMVQRWKKSYLGWASPDGENEYLLEELSEEISRHVSPLIRRLHDGSHIDQFEAHEFLEYCYGQLEDLRNELKKVERQDQSN